MGHLATYNCLKWLSEHFPTILTDSVQKASYLQEISNIQLNEKLSPVETDGHVPVQLDIWWGKVFKSSKYPTLTLVVKAYLSIFIGPHVETSFSHMNDIMNKKSNHMGIETYSGNMNIKHSLQTKTSSE